MSQPRFAPHSPRPNPHGHLHVLPKGRFRFVAVDVETASYESGSICQIGLAFVDHDGAIATYSTYVDPQSSFAAGNTALHGIDARRVAGAPTFARAMQELRPVMEANPLVQHSRFDEKAFLAGCARYGLPCLAAKWIDSVSVARKAWPEFRGKGGHGLAHLKSALGLAFHHHDAGEDARAAAQVILAAEARQGAPIAALTPPAQYAFQFDVTPE